MNFCIPGNLTVIKALFLLTLLAMPLIGCGIPSYPYLYPPTAENPNTDTAVLKFTHDGTNGDPPVVFKGYEIFYRFYANDPNTTGTSQAESDMRSYFTSSYQISSIISKTTTSTAYNQGFRRAMIEQTPDDTPQLSIAPSQISNSFQIELIQPIDPKAPIELNLSYDDKFYTLFRIVIDEDNSYKSFYPINDSYTENDTDIVDEGIDITTTANFFVAFFAVPYGTDPVSLAPLYANGSSEGMAYIGRFEIQ